MHNSWCNTSSHRFLSVRQRFILQLIQPLYERVGFEERLEDAHLDHFSRVNLLNWACSMGHKDCVQRSVDQFKRWMAEPDNDR